MSNYSRFAIYKILLKGDTFGEKVYDPEGIINGGKPFILYTETVKGFMEEVKNTKLDFDEVIRSSEEGAKIGNAQKEPIVALLKSIVESEKYSEGVVLERLRDGTVQELLKKL